MMLLMKNTEIFASREVIGYHSVLERRNVMVMMVDYGRAMVAYIAGYLNTPQLQLGASLLFDESFPFHLWDWYHRRLYLTWWAHVFLSSHLLLVAQLKYV